MSDVKPFGVEIRAVSPMKGKELLFRLHNADNEVFAFLDNDLFADKKTEGDPSSEDDFKISLGKGAHKLTVGGINWGGPAHFRWTVELDGTVKDVVDHRFDTSPNGLVYYVVYNITT